MLKQIDLKWKNIQTTILSWPWPLDPCGEVCKKVIKLHRKQQAETAHEVAYGKTQTWSCCCMDVICSLGGCYNYMWKPGKPQLFVLWFFLPSLPKLPCTCPNSSREFLRRRYAKTNYLSSRSFQKRTSFLGARVEVHNLTLSSERNTIHRTTGQEKINESQIADERNIVPLHVWLSTCILGWGNFLFVVEISVCLFWFTTPQVQILVYLVEKLLMNIINPHSAWMKRPDSNALTEFINKSTPTL